MRCRRVHEPSGQLQIQVDPWGANLLGDSTQGARFPGAGGSDKEHKATGEAFDVLNGPKDLVYPGIRHGLVSAIRHEMPCRWPAIPISDPQTHNSPQ